RKRLQVFVGSGSGSGSGSSVVGSGSSGVPGSAGAVRVGALVGRGAEVSCAGGPLSSSAGSVSSGSASSDSDADTEGEADPDASADGDDCGAPAPGPPSAVRVDGSSVAPPSGVSSDAVAGRGSA